jgi:hypothetical protein
VRGIICQKSRTSSAQDVMLWTLLLAAGPSKVQQHKTSCSGRTCSGSCEKQEGQLQLLLVICRTAQGKDGCGDHKQQHKGQD